MKEREALKRILEILAIHKDLYDLSINEIEDCFSDVATIARRNLERPYDVEKCMYCSTDAFDPDTPCKKSCLNGCQGDEFEGKPSHCSGLC